MHNEFDSRSVKMERNLDLNRDSPESLFDLLEQGNISPGEFRNKLVSLDQMDPEHSRAPQILGFLESPKMQGYMANHQDLLPEFQALSAFIAFHVGQIEACNGRDGYVFFEKAFTHASQGNSPDGWKYYITGTMAYLKSDVEGMEKSILQLPDGKNKNVLIKLLEGLQKRGEPDYKSDYLT